MLGYSEKQVFCLPRSGVMTFPPTNLIELAKQGDTDAIATLMNRHLEPRGIRADVSHTLDHLLVKLEADPVPDQASMANFVHRGLSNLGLNAQAIRVAGYRAGADTPDWEQDIVLQPLPEFLETPITIEALPDDVPADEDEPGMETVAFEESIDTSVSEPEPEPDEWNDVEDFGEIEDLSDEPYYYTAEEDFSADSDFLLLEETEHNDLAEPTPDIDYWSDATPAVEETEITRSESTTPEWVDVADQDLDRVVTDDPMVSPEGDFITDEDEPRPSIYKRLIWVAIAALATLTGVLLVYAFNRPRAPVPETLQPLPTPSTANEPTSPATEGSPVDAASAPAAPSPVTANPFRDAVNQATQAANLTQTAATAQEWELVAQLWGEASNNMAQITADDPNYAIAQQRVTQYKDNQAYALQKQAELQ